MKLRRKRPEFTKASYGMAPPPETPELRQRIDDLDEEMGRTVERLGYFADQTRKHPAAAEHWGNELVFEIEHVLELATSYWALRGRHETIRRFQRSLREGKPA